MHRRAIGLSCLALFAFAGLAQAQPGGTFVSGFQHDPVGAATLGTPNERRLPVQNLGSSGQDGVDIKFRTAYGGGVLLDATDLLNTPGATLTNRRKGWDGTIKGHIRMTSNGDGTGTLDLDFSGIGATALHVVEYDASGSVVSDETFAGPIAARPWVPNFTCDDGSTPILIEKWIKMCNDCPWVYWYGWACADGAEYTPGSPHGRIIVTPTLPTPAPEDPTCESMEISAGGIDQITVSDGEIYTFSPRAPGLPPGEPVIGDLSIYGVGGAHLNEQCDNPATGCAQTERRLPAHNLGSSGEDGAEIIADPRVKEIEVGLRKDRGCCPGHITLMKITDDAGTEQRIIRTNTDPVAGTDELDADFTSLGASGYRLTLYDDQGGVVGPSGGTDIISGGPKPYLTGRCPPPQWEKWINSGTAGNLVWTFDGCEGGYDFVLPDGTSFADVASFTVEPIGATTMVGPIARCTITGTDGQFTIGSVQTVHFCPSDYNLDGFVDGIDSDTFNNDFEAGNIAADYNGDGFVDGIDADQFNNDFEAGC